MGLVVRGDRGDGHLRSRRTIHDTGGVVTRRPEADAVTRQHLRHVYWIGGGSGAGKSTVARTLAARHGCRVYDSDQAMSDHGRRLSPPDSPLLQRFAGMDTDERWVNRSPQEMRETFHWFRGEGFDLIVDDLLHCRTIAL